MDNILISDSDDGSLASLPYSRCIFVMEDVDAASQVVTGEWLVAHWTWILRPLLKLLGLKKWKQLW